ncbi:mucin-2-like [Saccoglossus kowalevskii]|uniref:Zonadhesin-like n=1 Tax=Saccoglossus kowalevskii TaxID=10224 RepID=A0ABM0MFY6_SACKO|nr:PREDICTED: zonadhesin-like [Saccoglossus kowalevskii]
MKLPLAFFAFALLTVYCAESLPANTEQVNAQEERQFDPWQITAVFRHVWAIQCRSIVYIGIDEEFLFTSAATFKVYLETDGHPVQELKGVFYPPNYFYIVLGPFTPCQTIKAAVDIFEGDETKWMNSTVTTACPCETASETGDPHYFTFDKKNFTYQGPCGYVVSKDACNGGKPTFEICAINSGPEEDVKGPRFVIGVRVKTDNDELLLSPDTVLWNGEVVDKSTPHVSKDYKLMTYTIGNTFILYHTEYRWWIEVLRHAVHAYLYQDSPLHGNICGMFGNADGSPSTDMVLPDGTITTDDKEFGNAWRCENSCDYKEQLDALEKS